jgi:hypothetical protein
LVVHLISLIKYKRRAKEFIKNVSYVLDYWTNIGIFSIYAAYLNEKGKIYAIEPVKETADIMQRLLDFFEVKNVKIIRKQLEMKRKRHLLTLNHFIFLLALQLY